MRLIYKIQEIFTVPSLFKIDIFVCEKKKNEMAPMQIAAVRVEGGKRYHGLIQQVLTETLLREKRRKGKGGEGGELK